MLGFPIQKTGHALRKLLVAHRVSSELYRKYSGQKLDIKGISSLNASILIHIYQKAAINVDTVFVPEDLTAMLGKP